MRLKQLRVLEQDQVWLEVASSQEPLPARVKLREDPLPSLDARRYLRQLVKRKDEIEAFVKLDYHEKYDAASLGWTYDAELGWVLVDSIRHDGIHGSRTYYHYSASGARRRIHGNDQTARIHTYGDSFTHCDQVSDGETWQEYLAAHLREPIENYGVGGYSVYQAYLRMLKVERDRPADYIVLNIWDDDHFRNLDAWRSLRFGKGSRCGFTLPHVRVDLDQDHVEERGNICATPADVSKLCDLDWLVDTFADDPILAVVLDTAATRDPEASAEVALSFGLGKLSEADVIRSQLARQALRATRYVLEKTEAFVGATGKKLLVVLSYSQAGVRRALQGAPAWDQEILDFLQTRDYPFVDLRQHHLAEFERFRLAPDVYLARYYNGHYAPAGNFFLAQSLRETMVNWLDPGPLPYRSTASSGCEHSLATVSL